MKVIHIITERRTDELKMCLCLMHVFFWASCSVEKLLAAENTWFKGDLGFCSVGHPLSWHRCGVSQGGGCRPCLIAAGLWLARVRMCVCSAAREHLVLYGCVISVCRSQLDTSSQHLPLKSKHNVHHLQAACDLLQDAVLLPQLVQLSVALWTQVQWVPSPTNT